MRAENFHATAGLTGAGGRGIQGQVQQREAEARKPLHGATVQLLAVLRLGLSAQECPLAAAAGPRQAANGDYARQQRDQVHPKSACV